MIKNWEISKAIIIELFQFFGQWTLPKNHLFMYETADTSDEWCNKIIKQCDETASQRLKEVAAWPKMTKNPNGGNAPIGFISLIIEQLFKWQFFSLQSCTMMCGCFF